eukprot:8408992-Pyramimonas_sp.AAC.1
MHVRDPLSRTNTHGHSSQAIGRRPQTLQVRGNARRPIPLRGAPTGKRAARPPRPGRWPPL